MLATTTCIPHCVSRVPDRCVGTKGHRLLFLFGLPGQGSNFLYGFCHEMVLPDMTDMTRFGVDCERMLLLCLPVDMYRTKGCTHTKELFSLVWYLECWAANRWALGFILAAGLVTGTYIIFSPHCSVGLLFFCTNLFEVDKLDIQRVSSILIVDTNFNFWKQFRNCIFCVCSCNNHSVLMQYFIHWYWFYADK